MVTTLTADEMQWDEQQRADKVRRRKELLRGLKSFALALGLIGLTVAIATILAGVYGSAMRP